VVVAGKVRTTHDVQPEDVRSVPEHSGDTSAGSVHLHTHDGVGGTGGLPPTSQVVAGGDRGRGSGSRGRGGGGRAGRNWYVDLHGEFVNLDHTVDGVGRNAPHHLLSAGQVGSYDEDVVEEALVRSRVVPLEGSGRKRVSITLDDVI